MKYEIDAKEKGSFDCIVVGGGIAGVSAAVSAARNGAETLLIEKSVNLGGLATNGLVSWYEPLCDGEGHQIIYGLAEELIKLAAKFPFDNLPECWGGKDVSAKKDGRYATLFSPSYFSLVLDRFVEENGVRIRFDTLSVQPVMENGICKGVICQSADGAEFFRAKSVIDATGDASVCDRAGIPTVVGENYMTYVVHMYEAKSYDKLKNGDVCTFRKWEGSGSDLNGNGHPEGMDMLTGVTGDDVTKMMLCGKRRMLEKLEKRERNSFDIMALPSMPQFRTIRRIVGDCDFEAIPGKSYSDSIGKCSDFRDNGKGKVYEIPFGALHNSCVKNIFACGRIISAPAGDPWEVSRVIPVCALTGEAAGIAAANPAL